MVRRASPVRTCVGCRKRALAAELVRIVGEMREGELIALVPDLTRTKPGRGVHLHPDPACLALAERRRVFGRALRVAGVVDSGLLAEAVAGVSAPEAPTGSRRLGVTDGEAASPHPDQQGRTTDMSTR